ncbi:MAG: maleylpyruvate isomerase N-terminal domain-containing protein [Acidimicrobiales bacterium]|jgi:maleylpyruvate isomerase
MTYEGLTGSETAEIRLAVNGSRDATARLLSALAAIDDLDVTRPSLLPDWTVAHVLTHLARNADSFVRILRAASEDAQVPQYPGGAAGRKLEIEEGVKRAGQAILEDLAASAARLDATWDEVPEAVWQRQGLRADGSPLPCRILPISRWREVEVHHLDLGLGYAVSDWPAEFVKIDLPHALDRVPERLGDPAQGAAFLAWIYGRADGPSGFALRPF